MAKAAETPSRRRFLGAAAAAAVAPYVFVPNRALAQTLRQYLGWAVVSSRCLPLCTAYARLSSASR